MDAPALEGVSGEPNLVSPTFISSVSTFHLRTARCYPRLRVKKKARVSPRRRGADSGRPLLYSKTCQLAMRAMERIAAAEARDPEAWVPQASLADELQISKPSMAQIVYRLRKSGLLTAQRGPSGGIGLSRPPEEIQVVEVVRAIDGNGLAGRCVLGFDACTDFAPCPAHGVWSSVRPQLERELEQKSLMDLVHTVAAKARTATGKKRPPSRTAPRRSRSAPLSRRAPLG